MPTSKLVANLGNTNRSNLPDNKTYNISEPCLIRVKSRLHFTRFPRGPFISHKKVMGMPTETMTKVPEYISEIVTLRADKDREKHVNGSNKTVP